MLSDFDKTLVRLGAYIAALEAELGRTQAELAALKEKSVKDDTPKKG